jgi:membrane-bound serine protease (ClpP class)
MLSPYFMPGISLALLFAGGMISLIMGALILFSGTPFEVDAKVIAVIAAAVVFLTAILTFVIFAIIRAHRHPITTGKEGMIGQVAVARTRLDPSGTVFVEGALWAATTEGDRIEPGEEVIVTKVEGLKLKVVKKTK